MGIFDFIFRGSELSRYEAFQICREIAFTLHKEELSIEDLVRDFENILENIFQRGFPNKSIKTEQSRQIFGFSIYIYENHKDFLSDIEWRINRKDFDEFGIRTDHIWREPPPLPNYHDALHLFKEK